MANALPRSDSWPSNQPVATPASLSVVIEWVSKTIAPATATPTDSDALT